MPWVTKRERNGVAQIILEDRGIASSGRYSMVIQVEEPSSRFFDRPLRARGTFYIEHPALPLGRLHPLEVQLRLDYLVDLQVDLLMYLVEGSQVEFTSTDTEGLRRLLD